MTEEKQEMSLTMVLTLMGVVIINLTIGIVHIVNYLFLSNASVWNILPIVDAVLIFFLSWQILQIVNTNHVNFGFQLGGLWAVATFILDFFLYILPQPGSATDAIAAISSSLFIHYGVIILIPVLIGMYHLIRRKLKGSNNG
mgnify:CR=1 FL=1